MLKKLDSAFVWDAREIEDKTRSVLSKIQEKDVDVEAIREKIEGLDYPIGILEKPKECAGYAVLASDSSIVTRDVKYNTLWALHSTTVYAEYDGKKHEDVVSGHGSVPYKNMMYDSLLDVGVFSPQGFIDQRANHVRLSSEYEILCKSLAELTEDGFKVDYLLVDGSPKKTRENLAGDKKEFPEHKKAVEAQEKLLKTGKTVGMVEDSHANDVTSKLDLALTDVRLFDIILHPMEYVIESSGQITVCYIKLPSKRVSYEYTRKSTPITVRWEFTQEDYAPVLMNLFSAWLMEDDILHPQTYPTRLADYLSRKIKVGGVLDEIISKAGLTPEYREMRSI